MMGDLNLPIDEQFIQRLIRENDLFDVTQLCGRESQQNIHTYKRFTDYTLAS